MSEVFISYASVDGPFVKRLADALSARARECWVDVDGVEPADRWKLSTEEAIERSDAFAFVLSRASLASDPCLGELDHAQAHNKRVIVICLDEDVKSAPKPQVLADLSWIVMRSPADFDSVVERLIHALDTDLEVARMHTRILVRARSWEQAGRRASPLLRGDDLSSAEDWLARSTAGRRPLPTDLQREFIAASRHASTRRQRLGLGIAAIVTLLAVGLSIFALVQRQQAITNQKIAQSRQLAADAEANLADDPPLSTLLALESARVRHTVQAERSLRDALRSLRTIVSVKEPEVKGSVAEMQNAAFSPDGSRIVTVAQVTGGHTADVGCVWNAHTGAQIATLKGQSVDIFDAAFSSDGSQVVTADGEKPAEVWDARTGQPVASLGFAPSGGSVAVSSDGTRVVTAGSGGVADVWNPSTNRLIAHLDSRAEAVASVAISPDGRRAVTTTEGKAAEIWDARTGARLLELQAGSRVNTVAFSPDGSQIVTADADGTTRIWNAHTGEQLQVLRGHAGEVLDATFSPDGLRVVTGGLDEAARLWEVRTGQLLAVLKGEGGEVLSATFSPDGSRILTASLDDASVWDARLPEIVALQGHTKAVSDARFSRDGARIVTASFDGSARVWDARTGAQLAVMKADAEGISSASFSPGGSQVLTTGFDGTARTWNAHTGELLHTMGRVGGETYSAEYSPDGSRIVTASADFARVWDADSGSPVAVLEHGGRTVTTAEFSPDGTRVVTSGQGGVIVSDARTGNELVKLKGNLSGSVYSARFSADGSRLVTAGLDDTADVWDAHSGALLATMRGDTSTVVSVAFSPDGTRVVTASDDETARIWNAATGEQLFVLRGHKGWVYSAEFSPDGLRVLTVGDDGTVRIWDASTGEQLMLVHGYTAAYSRDGARIVTGGGWEPERGREVAHDAGRYHTAQVWSTELTGPLGSLERLARGLVEQPLTHEQRKQYLAGIS